MEDKEAGEPLASIVIHSLVSSGNRPDSCSIYSSCDGGSHHKLKRPKYRKWWKHQFATAAGK